MDAKHHCLFCSAETHVLGIQRFCKTHFMLIVYLIRNSNCLWGLINLWQDSLATSLWYEFVWSLVSWHCHHQLFWQEIWNNSKGEFQSSKHHKEFIQHGEKSSVSCNWATLSAMLQIMRIFHFSNTELAALVGDFLLYWMNPCLVPTSTKHVFF